MRTWKIEIANAGTLPVQIEVTRGFETPYWTLKLTGGDATYRKHDATHARFELTVPPETDASFRVRSDDIPWCSRRRSRPKK